MIEPTESEPLSEMDRLVDALISIRKEIEEVESGKVDPVNNVLKNAPHTQLRILSDEWKFPYSREAACYPNKWVKMNKMWPTVARVVSISHLYTSLDHISPLYTLYIYIMFNSYTFMPII